jgi:hypothetical protein
LDIPEFLLRKLYKRGSLRETAPGKFSFTLRNPLGSATLLAPPRLVVNGIAYSPQKMVSAEVEPESISAQTPFRFAKGDEVTLQLPGHLLRGGNIIQLWVQTKEFGELSFEVEDKEAEFCDLPGADATETLD